jgi:hypothetical protein
VYKKNNSIKIPSNQANNPGFKDKPKMKNDEKDYAQKFNFKKVSCQPREAQQALQRPKKAQQTSHHTQESLNQENKQGKVVYMIVQENNAYICSLE